MFAYLAMATVTGYQYLIFFSSFLVLLLFFFHLLKQKWKQAMKPLSVSSIKTVPSTERKLFKCPLEPLQVFCDIPFYNRSRTSAKTFSRSLFRFKTCLHVLEDAYDTTLGEQFGIYVINKNEACNFSLIITLYWQKRHWQKLRDPAYIAYASRASYTSHTV